jgi:hypothetical protein
VERPPRQLEDHVPGVTHHLCSDLDQQNTSLTTSASISCAARGRRAEARATHDAAADADNRRISPHHARGRSAALIKHVWKVDPLVCARRGGRMKIVSFISPTQRHVIDKILTHVTDPHARRPPNRIRLGFATSATWS